MARTAAVDRILVSVIGNRFDAISKQIGQTMLRTSRSPIFSEARDFVTAIFDKQLRLVAQTAYIPILMGAQPYAMRSIAEHFGDDVDEGEVFILKEPYRGNNHPPDATVGKPAFGEGGRLSWCMPPGDPADAAGGRTACTRASATSTTTGSTRTR